jgi:ribosome maturation factor RimP
MPSEDIRSKIENILAPVLEKLGFEIVDVEFSNSPEGRILRIFIDIYQPDATNPSITAKAITLADCEKASAAAGEVLDGITTIDALKGHYILEVSSPGINRVLKKPKDFLRFRGKLAKISVYEPINGSRHFTGRILNLENDVLTIALNDDTPNNGIGATASFSLKSIARARLEPEL